jgi:hypothetical protein
MISMNNANCEMKMPTHYVDMSQTELKFDGGWSWGKFLTAVAIAGVAIVAIGGALAIGGVVATSGALAASGLYTIGAGVAIGVGGLTALLVVTAPEAKNDKMWYSESSGPA